MRRILVAFLLVFASLDTRANVELTLKVKRTSKPPEGVRPVGERKSDEESALLVILGGTYFRCDEGNVRTIYDFAQRRIYRIDLATKRLDDQSLFADVGHRVAELDNRAFLGEAFDKAGVAGNPLALTLAEHDLSVRHAGNVVKIDSTTTGGEQRHSWKGKELMAWSVETLPVKPDERDHFVRFLRYRFSGHPDILDALRRVDGIPRSLRVVTSAMLGETAHLEVSTIRTVPDSPYEPIDAKEVVEDPEMATAVAAVKASTPGSRRDARTKILTRASADAGASRFLDAMVGFLEVGLMTGEGLPTEFLAHKETITADAEVHAFLGALRPANEQQAHAAIVTFDRLQGIAPAKASVIGIFRANMEERVGDREAASAGYRAALRGNPLLTGVWKDLGQVLYRRFQAPDAWHCWDTARLIERNHPLLEDIDRLEARLLENQPEYF